MCGIAGVFDFMGSGRHLRPDIRAMIGALTHRGPEKIGIFEGECAALAQARLSIIDLIGGWQPMPNEDGTIWATCNGEFFDYEDVRRNLTARGHTLRTSSDSEIILHLYEMYGTDAIHHVMGQFAFGLLDRRRRRLWLGRDHVGIRPLYYTIHNGFLLFASEIKALLAAGVPRRVHPQGLAQVFTTWGPLPGQTMFAGIYELPAGHFLMAEEGDQNLRVEQYWQLDFTPSAAAETQSTAELVAEGRALLTEAVRTRLVADVEVGAYLSGGLDSSLTVSLAQGLAERPLHTYSITFDDAEFDERAFQQQAAAALGTKHHVVHGDKAQVQVALPSVVWHSETPSLRLAPVPMQLLAKFVHEQGLKVVLTGEGADEFFGGYTIFREAMVRRFMARQPDSEIRPLLLKRLYQYQPALQKMPVGMLKLFFGRGLDRPDAPHFSHMIRWENGARGLRFLSDAMRDALGDYDAVETAVSQLPPAFADWNIVGQAQYIEAAAFMPMYLLSTQGDRMAMTHAVEGRYPFLDSRVIEWINRLPLKMKIRGLRGEKYLLKQIANGLIPDAIMQRPKQPYRAPIQAIFARLPDYATDSLAPDAVQRAGLFSAEKVAKITRRIIGERPLSRSDQMSFMGILTSQLWHQMFIQDAFQPARHNVPVMDMAQHYGISTFSEKRL
ncbi:MAG: asparagine synthase (glutamine-hydrolyzing) [Chloroflexi bacterium]|nr:asparagine synthase (glutamine-hydrolyzing) [Chloroflexota bacterium]